MAGVHPLFTKADVVLSYMKLMNVPLGNYDFHQEKLAGGIVRMIIPGTNI